MRFGLCSFVNPPSRVSEIDLDATRADRERLHAEVRARNHVIALLQATGPDDDNVRVTPYEIHAIEEHEPASVEELFQVATEQTGRTA